MIYIFYISFFLKYNTVDEKVKKGMISVETIFPREENAEHIFKKNSGKIMMPVND